MDTVTRPFEVQAFCLDAFECSIEYTNIEVSLSWNLAFNPVGMTAYPLKNFMCPVVCLDENKSQARLCVSCRHRRPELHVGAVLDTCK